MLKLFSSMKFGLFLMAAIIVASIIATFVPELTIFESFWFRGFLLLLSVNLLFCSLRRLPSIIKQINKKIDPADIIIEKNMKSMAIGKDIGLEEKITNHFKKRGYRVWKSTISDKKFLFARKGLTSILAPHLLHLSLVIVLIGAFLGTYGHEEKIEAAVGETILLSEKFAEDFKIKINNFQTIYDDDRNIKNWESDLTIIVDDRVVVSGSTSVNHPFKYRGIVFYQTAYGYRHSIEITGFQEGVYDVPDGKFYTLAGKYFKIENRKEGPVISIFESHTSHEIITLQKGQSLKFSDDITLKYRETVPYTVITVKKDPGTPLVLFGFALIAFSSLLFLTARYREIKLLLDTKGKMVFYSIKSKNEALKEEIKRDLINLMEE